MARDLVLCVDHVPGDHEAVPATERIVVLDGAPPEPALLDGADVLRADANEAEQLTGAEGADAAIDAGRDLLARHDLRS